MGDDDFAILLPANSSLLRQLETDLISYVRQYRGNAGFLPAMGVYMITDTSVTTQTMYDHAVLALNSVKGNYLKRFRIYDASMMEQMEKDHKLLVAIQSALKNQEFTFYLQPKCNLSSGKIVALESLVRWKHPTQGVINPGSFIPFLEKNGFITVLDIYIWDLVCQRLKAWLDTGRPVLPVSVNVSRIDIYSIDIPEHFKSLIEKYKLPPKLLVIEITESAYAEDYELITKVGDQLRSYGFPISMDDFGSGYSSLNMLKDMHFDELKIDMKFLPMNAGTKKETGILESIVSMARLMDLTIIAEGIETKEQLDLLQNMGCRYGQGYYFYHPMPYEEFETLRQDETRFDFRGTKVLHIEHLSIKDLMNQNLFSESVLNNILGGIAFYEVYNDNVELLRANEQYCMITEISPFDLEEQRKSIMDNVYPKDRDIVWDIFHRAQHNSLLGAEGSIRRLKADGSVIWIHLRIFFLKEQDGHIYYYGSINATAARKIREKDRALHLSIRRSESLLTQAGVNTWEWNLSTHTLTLHKRFPENEERILTFNHFPGDVLKLAVLPEETKNTLYNINLIQSNFAEPPLCQELPFYTESGDSLMWLEISCAVIKDENGFPVEAVGLYRDITNTSKAKKES